VLFGGETNVLLGDTWIWSDRTWRVPFVAHLHLSPRSGPPGTVVRLKGMGFAAFEQVTITFIDSVAGKTVLGTFATNGSGTFMRPYLHGMRIPQNSTVGTQKIRAVGAVSHQQAKATFTVT
jgi:hypothetical protein